MTDFHTHILPGMDDGSRDLRESLEMLRQEARQGVTAVALTPHFYASQNSPEEFLLRREQALAELESALEPGMPRLLPGAEVRYFEGICHARALDRLRIETTELLLLEMPMGPWDQRMVGNVLELNRRDGMQVLLAHVERYPQVPEAVWQTLQEEGVLMQANVSFFANWKTRHKALGLVRKGRVHLLGTDCHSMGRRPPDWEKLPEKAKYLQGAGAQWLARQGEL